MKLASWKAKLWGTPTFTWAGHAYMTAIPTLFIASGLSLWLGLRHLEAQAVYVGFTVLMGLFYGFREQNDEMHHRMREDYDLPQGHQGVLSSRIDKVGDSFGPFLTVIVAACTVAVGWQPWVAVGLAAAATAALARQAVRIIRR